MKNSIIGLYTFGCLVILILQPSECVEPVESLGTVDVHTWGFTLTWQPPTTGVTPTCYEVTVEENGVKVDGVSPIKLGNTLQTVIRDLSCGGIYTVCVISLVEANGERSTEICLSSVATLDCMGFAINMRNENELDLMNGNNIPLETVTYQQIDEITGNPTGIIGSVSLSTQNLTITGLTPGTLYQIRFVYDAGSNEVEIRARTDPRKPDNVVFVTREPFEPCAITATFSIGHPQPNPDTPGIEAGVYDYFILTYTGTTSEISNSYKVDPGLSPATSELSFPSGYESYHIEVYSVAGIGAHLTYSVITSLETAFMPVQIKLIPELTTPSSIALIVVAPSHYALPGSQLMITWESITTGAGSSQIFPRGAISTYQISNMGPRDLHTVTLLEFVNETENETIDIVTARPTPNGISTSDITTEITETTIELCWIIPNGGYSLVEVTYTPSPFSPHAHAYTQDENQRCFTLVGLDPAQTYCIFLTPLRCLSRGDCEGGLGTDCTDDNGVRGAFASVSATTLAGVAGHCNIKEVTRTTVSISYNEAPDASLYTLEIFSNNIQVGPDENRASDYERLYTFTGLSPATQYEIRVTLTGGNYPQQTCSVFTTPNAPGTPVLVYAFQDGFRVNWIGSAGATHYEVTATDPNSLLRLVSKRVAHPITEVDITGLAELTEYDVTVTAGVEEADSRLVTFSDPSAVVAMTTGAQIIRITGYTSTSISLSGLGSSNILDYSPSSTASNGKASPITLAGSTEILPGLFPGRLYKIILTRDIGAQHLIIDKVFQNTLPQKPTIIKAYQGVIGYHDQTTFAVVVNGPDPTLSEFDAITIEYLLADGFKPQIQRFDNLQASDLPLTVIFDGLTAGEFYTFSVRAYSGEESSEQASGNITLGMYKAGKNKDNAGKNQS
ncbi:tenascin-R-like [Amphiura filiformis]|uniref:tenascin-R-like n=1 Tax=Amphiura filiformis TaxID=82378 RepID=UPI003B21D652